MDEERAKMLLMGLMDGELDVDETREINELLRRNKSLREEYDVLLDANEVLSVLSQTKIDEASLRKVWKSPFRKGLRWLSYFFIALGFLVLMGLGFYQYILSGEGNLLIIVSVGGILAGCITLLVQVIRDRLIVYKSDPYREIEK